MRSVLLLLFVSLTVTSIGQTLDNPFRLQNGLHSDIPPDFQIVQYHSYSALSHKKYPSIRQNLAFIAPPMTINLPAYSTPRTNLQELPKGLFLLASDLLK